MFVKIMSGQDMPDRGSNKDFELYECTTASFHRNRAVVGSGNTAEPVSVVDQPVVVVDGRDVFLTGNAYILNDAGKTIESYAFNG